MPSIRAGAGTAVAMRPLRWLCGLLLAATIGAAQFAHAVSIPAGWDLTFKAQRAEAPPIRSGWNDTFNLYQKIDKRGWQMRYLLQQVPLDSLDAAVFVQGDFRRHGLFVQGERAYLMLERGYASFDVRPVNADDARRLIRRYAEHDGPTTTNNLASMDAIHCTSKVARSVVSLLVDGKPRQYWLSGADYCEIPVDLLAPVKEMMCGGHCYANKMVDRWAATLERDVQTLPATGPVTGAAPGDARTGLTSRAPVLRDAAAVLRDGGTPEAMCYQLNQLLDLPSPTRRGEGRDYRDSDDAEITAAMLALLGRLDATCAYRTGSPMLHVLVRRSPVAVIELALQRGFPVNQIADHTPLDDAIFEKREDVQQILRRAGGVQHTTAGK
ncbi:hypothetical protein [Duganella violaceipulchra]|uniref:Ankyrin repeat domain-containing protein n=1 Tax=Duganella violaceipulchra TaxID=2849652 RepID=A0AA41H7S0_9BURK|nr:hypothetical protein [Duganella violaceicalia]MBV6322139.1 hypothetical protein [Duganella violaceicalia]MCP2011286.1 hypothetical protein [Duganella violaceicalia]